MALYTREFKYRAWQFTYIGIDEEHPLPRPLAENQLIIPDWILGAIDDGIIRYENIGTMWCNGINVNIGDYIVMHKDEYEVYTKDDFKRLFKKVED